MTIFLRILLTVQRKQYVKTKTEKVEQKTHTNFGFMMITLLYNDEKKISIINV